MLEELRVRDLALIDDVCLAFAPGMTVLTGETGAGKTALVEALKLLVGERADSMMVRSGSAEAIVEGRFLVDGTELVARRRVGADGRSRCTIDDEMATVSALAARLGPLVDLHGQHDHQALLSPATHVDYLDRHAGSDIAEARHAYSQAYERYSDAVRMRDEHLAAMADAERQADYLGFVVSEIARAAIHVGEDEELETRLPGLRHADRLIAAVSQAVSALREDGGASDSVAVSVTFLGKVVDLDPTLDAVAARLADVETELVEVSGALRQYGESLEHDPAMLDEVEARLATLTSLKKKYGPTLADVARTHDEAAERLAVLEAGEEGLELAERAAAEAEAVLRSAASVLEQLRQESVPAFVDALTAASAELAMSSARFEVAFSQLPFDSWTAAGPHKVEFLFAPSAAEPARPLARIASGGEISRVMLALKSVLGDADDVPILVFDEIDSGIGGATAHAVGRRLAALARDRQVIVVTHLAQVAVFAQRQLVVTRTAEDGRASTRVDAVEGDDRVSEIARMLSGSDSDASFAHAEQLLRQARD